MLGSLLCPHGSSSVLLDPYGSTISETTSEAWSVEVLPSDSGTNIPLVVVAAPPSPRMRFIRVYGSLAQTAVGCGGGGGWDTASARSAFQARERKGGGGKKKRKKTVCVQLSWCFLCTCLSFSVDVRCAGGRQLRVPSEGPPGVFAPVVEQRVGGGWRWGGRRGSSCLQSVLSH